MKKILLVLAAFTAVFIGFTGYPNAAQNRPDPVPPVKEHTVAFNAADENGELIAKSDGKIITSSAKIAEGKIVTFTAKPKTGYVADTWTIEGASFESGTGAPNSDSASVKVSADTTVKVSFKVAGIGMACGVVRLFRQRNAYGENSGRRCDCQRKRSRKR